MRFNNTHGLEEFIRGPLSGDRAIGIIVLGIGPLLHLDPDVRGQPESAVKMRDTSSTPSENRVAFEKVHGNTGAFERTRRGAADLASADHQCRAVVRVVDNQRSALRNMTAETQSKENSEYV